MTVHSFDPLIAKQVGVNAATIYQNIKFWCEKNRANKKHFHNGVYWTYNSISAFKELFVYLSEKQIRTAISKLIKAKLIEEGNFNKVGYDRTKWYNVNETLNCPKGKTDLTKRANGFDQKGKPIPYSKPDINHMSVDFEEFWKICVRKEAKDRAGKNYKSARKNADKQTILSAMQAYNETCEKENTDKRYIKRPANWLSDGMYNDVGESNVNDEWKERMALFKKGKWLESWGPRPDEQGTRVPQQLIGK